MEYSKQQLRTWSMLGARGTFGSALYDIAKNNQKIVALSADLCNTSGLDRFAKDFPDRFINVGIAEQNMIGVASGLADMGYIPFATTFANFAALRSCEFVRHFMGYMESNVKLVGLSAGYGMEFFGNTHYGVEDIAVLRSIPNIVIVSPADGLEIVKCVQTVAEMEGPVYIRLTGIMNAPIVYKQDYDFKIGEAVVHRSGGKIALVANGVVLKNVLEAANLLFNDGIEVDVIDMHTIKPLDTDCIDSLKEKEIIFTIEEHSRVGGLGSAIAEYVAEKKYDVQIIRLGTKERYTKAGSYEYKIQEMGLDTNSIVQSIKGYL